MFIVVEQQLSRTVEELDHVMNDTFSCWHEGWIGINYPGYLATHISLVRKNAEVLADNHNTNKNNKEKVDKQVLGIAAQFHDITKKYDGPVLKNGERSLRYNDIAKESDLTHRNISAEDVHAIEQVRKTDSVFSELHDYIINSKFYPHRKNGLLFGVEQANLHYFPHNISGSFAVRTFFMDQRINPEITHKVSNAVYNHIKPIHDSGIEGMLLHDADELASNYTLVGMYRLIMYALHKGKSVDELCAVVSKQVEKITPHDINECKEYKPSIISTPVGELLAEEGREKIRWLEKCMHLEQADQKNADAYGICGLFKLLENHKEEPRLDLTMQSIKTYVQRVDHAHPFTRNTIQFYNTLNKEII